MTTPNSESSENSQFLSPMRIRFFLIVFLIAIFFFAKILWPFWPILLLSFLLTNLFRPVYTLLCSKLRMPESISSIITCLLIIAIVFIPIVFFILTLAGEALNLYQWSRDSRVALKIQMFIQESPYAEYVQEYLREVGFNFQPAQVSDALTYLAKTGGLLLYNQASGWAANIMQFIFMFFMMILVIFFLLIDMPKLVNYMVKLSPLPDDEDRLLINRFEQIANAVLKGNGICGLIQGILAGSLFSIIGISSPILWGCVMAILAFLPIFGIGLVMVPTAIFLGIDGRIGTAIFVFVFYLLLSFSVEYLVKPKMVGSQVEMHTLLVFLSIIGGLSVYGILGIIYGPLIMTAFLTLSDMYINKYDEQTERL